MVVEEEVEEQGRIDRWRARRCVATVFEEQVLPCGSCDIAGLHLHRHGSAYMFSIAKEFGGVACMHETVDEWLALSFEVMCHGPYSL